MARRSGLICGLDEAGRGALAGPVVAAAVVFDRPRPLRGLADSKLLTAAQREWLAERIVQRAVAWGVGEASCEEINRLNILRAALLAMQRAFEQLEWDERPLSIIVDGCHYPEGLPPGRALAGADGSIGAVSAAGILAKVHRDRLMCELEKAHPQFSFARHKGYCTPQHLRELLEHGPLPHHRAAFAPVRRLLQGRFWP